MHFVHGRGQEIFPRNGDTEICPQQWIGNIVLISSPSLFGTYKWRENAPPKWFHPAVGQ